MYLSVCFSVFCVYTCVSIGLCKGIYIYVRLHVLVCGSGMRLTLRLTVHPKWGLQFRFSKFPPEWVHYTDSLSLTMRRSKIQRP